jgi:acyl carrier protein
MTAFESSNHEKDTMMTMNQESALRIIFRALENLNEERDIAHQIPVQASTKLFGSESQLDSLSLVSVIADVEMAVSDEVGEPVSLTDDRALSQQRSPFLDVTSLSDYILQLTSSKG